MTVSFSTVLPELGSRGLKGLGFEGLGFKGLGFRVQVWLHGISRRDRKLLLLARAVHLL